jgi:hypothetical protein
MTGGSPKLPCPKTGPELLDMYYLEIRSHLLETAAAFDRLERSPDWERIKDDQRLRKLRASLEVLGSSGTDRAERFLKLFSV